MAWWVDKFCSEIRNLVNERQDKVDKIKEVEESIKNGKNYFQNRIDNATSKELLDGTERMIELINELQKLNKEVFDLDVVIVAELEAYLGNFIGRVRIPQKITDAGDIEKSKIVYAVPFHDNDSHLEEITPDDVWFLKLIKSAYKSNNIAFEKKNDV